MQITIQKKYLILVEVSENIFRVFLVIVNFVFTFVENKAEEARNVWSDFKENILSKTFNFVRALFGFNIYKLELIQIRTKTNFNKNFAKNKNQDFLIFSNLLAPPQR